MAEDSEVWIEVHSDNMELHDCAEMDPGICSWSLIRRESPEEDEEERNGLSMVKSGVDHPGASVARPHREFHRLLVRDERTTHWPYPEFLFRRVRGGQFLSLLHNQVFRVSEISDDKSGREDFRRAKT